VPLPVQALDHATGRILAAAAIRGLTLRSAAGQRAACSGPRRRQARHSLPGRPSRASRRCCWRLAQSDAAPRAGARSRSRRRWPRTATIARVLERTAWGRAAAAAPSVRGAPRLGLGAPCVPAGVCSGPMGRSAIGKRAEVLLDSHRTSAATQLTRSNMGGSLQCDRLTVFTSDERIPPFTHTREGEGIIPVRVVVVAMPLSSSAFFPVKSPSGVVPVVHYGHPFSSLYYVSTLRSFPNRLSGQILLFLSVANFCSDELAAEECRI